MGILDWLWPGNWFKKEDVSEEYIVRAMQRLGESQDLLSQHLETIAKRITHFNFPEEGYENEIKILNQASKGFMSVALTLRHKGYSVHDELQFLLATLNRIDEKQSKLRGSAFNTEGIRSMITIIHDDLKEISKNTGMPLRELCVAHLRDLKDEMK